MGVAFGTGLASETSADLAMQLGRSEVALGLVVRERDFEVAHVAQGNRRD